MRTVWDIIKSPVITEKALSAKEETQDASQLLTFRVDRRATKPEIKSPVETRPWSVMGPTPKVESLRWVVAFTVSLPLSTEAVAFQVTGAVLPCTVAVPTSVR